MLFTHNYFSVAAARQSAAKNISFSQRRSPDAPLRTFQGNKKAPTHDEKGRQNGCALLIFPKLMMLELELAPDVENQFNRLPWCHRASPSTTLYESVKSTDADRLMQSFRTVKNYFSGARFSSKRNHLTEP